ncbi:hypothetical protein WI988_005022, partial [Klebsiella pneumoniae]
HHHHQEAQPELGLLSPWRGDTLLIRHDGRTELAKLMGRSFIARDGEALDDVHVHGVVTFTICDVRQDNAVV